MILASFAAATFVVRLAMPWIARRANERQVLTVALVCAGAVYLAFPFLTSAPALGALSFVLGLGLGSGQPMVLSLLHAHAPPGRVGEAVGMRMSLMQTMAVAVPLVFGALGSSIGILPGVLVGRACSSGPAATTRDGRAESSSFREAGTQRLWTDDTGSPPSRGRRRLPTLRAARFFSRSAYCLRNFDDLRRHDEHAVRLPGIVLEVVLVVALGGVERCGAGELGDDRLARDSFASSSSLHDALRGRALLVGVCAKITERYCVPTSLPCRLSVVGSWIVKNTAQQIAKGELGGIERHLDHFRVPGAAAADRLVRRDSRPRRRRSRTRPPARLRGRGTPRRGTRNSRRRARRFRCRVRVSWQLTVVRGQRGASRPSRRRRSRCRRIPYTRGRLSRMDPL